MNSKPIIAYNVKNKKLLNFRDLEEQIYIRGRHFPIFHEDFVIMLGARRGAGKSWLCEQIINIYAQLNPTRRIFYISRIKKDDGLKLPKKSLRLDLFEEYIPLLEKKIDLSIFKNSVIVFDDIYDSRLNKKQQIMLLSSITDLLENGRHDKISLILTAHSFLNGKNCMILNELSHIVVYPAYSNLRQIRNVLKEYIGMDKKYIDLILKSHSRYIIISTIGQKYIMSENGIMYWN
jgi:GTPase SAR1 family protein